jgi:selenocysteine lyase/cysteine desulfurase
VHFPADVQRLDIDFYAFSGHKLYGPTGIGALYGKSALLDAMSPWLGGGKMITEVTFAGFATQPVPYRLEAGTPNIAGVIGLSAALEWLEETDIAQAENWSRSLATLAEDELAKRPGFRSFRCQESSLLAFDFAGVHHSDMVTLLAESGLRCVPDSTAPNRCWRRWALAVPCAPRLPPIILRMMFTRWCMPLTALWKYWWINDDFSPFWYRHHRRDLTPDVYPAQPVGR